MCVRVRKTLSNITGNLVRYAQMPIATSLLLDKLTFDYNWLYYSVLMDMVMIIESILSALWQTISENGPHNDMIGVTECRLSSRNYARNNFNGELHVAWHFASYFSIRTCMFRRFFIVQSEFCVWTLSWFTTRSVTTVCRRISTCSVRKSQEIYIVI